MLTFSKIICALSIYWTLSDASLIGGVENWLVPGGISNAAENARLSTLDLAGIAGYYGYETDTKNVITEDSYILTVHCVYKSTALNYFLNPVIAWHGLSTASNSYVLNDPDQALAFLLADRGYYVCLPNSRGNGYSQGHLNASRNANKLVDPFYQYSWDQIAEYDVPAVIDAVLHWRRKSQVIYIGHSQATTTMFGLLSTKTAYNAKVSIFVALAPIVYLRHVKSPLFVGGNRFLSVLKKLYGSQYSSNTIQSLLHFNVCKLPTQALCKSLLFWALGNSTHTNDDRLPLYLYHLPAGYSWGQVLHNFQNVEIERFQKYDFEGRNQQIYGQSTPPGYDLTQVSAPVAIFHSDSDLLTANVDIQTLKSQLRNLVYVQHLGVSEGFNHLDYIWAKDVAEIVYAHLFELIRYY